VKADGASSVVLKRDDINARVPAVARRNDFRDGEAEPYPCARFLVEMRDEPPVSFRPRDKRLRLVARRAHPRSEVEEAGPRARLFDGQSVIVAARIINEPAQARRVEAARA